MNEAIRTLRQLREKVFNERLGDEILTGIDMCITELVAKQDSDRWMQDVGY